MRFIYILIPKQKMEVFCNMRLRPHKLSFSEFLARAVKVVLQNLAEKAEDQRRRKLEQDSIEVEYKVKT